MNQHWTKDGLQGRGIRFNDYIFTEPERLLECAPPRCAGVFAILVQDHNWAPKPFQPLWFGEFGNNAQHLFTDQPPHGESLYLSVFPMLFSTTEQRCAVRDRLVWAYNPILQSNKRSPIFGGEWAHKLRDLERKHEEHTAELCTLLGNTSPELLGAQPRRRRIGFLPDPLPSI
jgi:hypothetical protein